MMQSFEVVWVVVGMSVVVGMWQQLLLQGMWQQLLIVGAVAGMHNGLEVLTCQ
jgi:hypothetical protein